MGLTASTLYAANLPTWTATIPAPSFPGLVASAASVTSDAPSSTLVEIRCVNSNTPPNNAAGTQLVLLDAKGQVLATGEIAHVGGGTTFAWPDIPLIVSVTGDLRIHELKRHFQLSAAGGSR